MAVPLASRLRESILRDGPMPFSAWMEACLYDPEGGYYMRPGRKTGAGAGADFATPPTLHPFFATAVGRELASCWVADGRPAAFTVVEFGGGEGDLARGAMAALGESSPGFRWQHRERSPEHRRRQGPGTAAIGPAPAGPVAADAAVLCEVLDAIACDLLDARGAPLSVAVEGDGFRLSGDVHHADGGAAAAWLAGEARRVRHVLVVDYGERRPAREARGYRRHAMADPLSDPGGADVTVPVDFAAVASAMAGAGFREAAFEPLESFLLRHGVLDELNATDRSTREGASSYLRLRQLLLPTGLGSAFKVQRFERA